jgi:DNA anti-recombination protein RmuC
MRERAAEFRKTFHDALVETTGQIRGRLQMATEMMEQPLEKLRQQAAEQLQEQAGRQSRHLREHADEVTERLRGLQRDIETAVRESLRAQAAETVATCGREIAEIAQRTVEEWRATLASNLESLTSLLGQPIPRDRQ